MNKIKKEEKRNFEENIVNKAGDNEKLFHKSIRSKLAVKDQLLRVKKFREKGYSGR